MARIDKEEQARREGMAYAFKIAKERGIDGLEKELRLRNITKLPVAIKEKDVEEWCDGMKNQTVDSVGILAMVSLRDGFGFGKKRLLEFFEIYQPIFSFQCTFYFLTFLNIYSFCLMNVSIPHSSFKIAI